MWTHLLKDKRYEGTINRGEGKAKAGTGGQGYPHEQMVQADQGKRGMAK
jgi:hypothetical protein